HTLSLHDALPILADGAGLHRVAHLCVLGERGEHEHAAAHAGIAHPAERGHTVELRHQQVHDHDVRRQIHRQPHGALAIAGLADDDHVVLVLEKQPQSFTHYRVIVCDEQTDTALAHGLVTSAAGTVTSTRVPAPGFVSMRARYRPVRPRALSWT